MSFDFISCLCFQSWYNNKTLPLTGELSSYINLMLNLITWFDPPVEALDLLLNMEQHRTILITQKILSNITQSTPPFYPF